MTQEKRKLTGIGYPVIIKAALGGGGKGMRTAFSPEEFEKAFLTAQKEAQMAFGDGYHVHRAFCGAAKTYRISDSGRQAGKCDPSWESGTVPSRGIIRR